MTIKELKAELDKLPENEQIYVIDADTGDLMPVFGTTTKKIKRIDEKGVFCIASGGYDSNYIPTEY